MYEKEPQHNETFLKPKKFASPLAFRFMISRFHCTKNIQMT